ncbi:MAG: 16S rRNA (cytosine(967)-C(5))-methyltransferase RsmB [Eubacterium sp.]|nr:16S rRNA (cytosine(967)-C(5))-methyltransferase RsmB [Eubacterium sp.]MCM1215319.1 16S rRNA (cytosine(967)-C(5))-methyltransferase RsmB [Lachnospiraceae bacterium]MCM1240199.1 16S rRNA (cytosine(967)-C(5))-methyltransferase RsmB [Lachnospiraceae bacterium]
MADNIREIVLDTLLELEKGGEYSHRLIRAVLDKYDYLDSRDKSFIKRLAEGTIERQIELDYDLDHISSLPVQKMKSLIRCLLRMSAYQLLYMDTVPDSAVCNEAVKLAGKRGFRNLQGFVNAVLRNLSKQKGTIPLPDAQKEPERYLSVKYSMPVWLVGLWLSEYGREVTERILSGLMRVHPVSVRFSSGLSEQEREDRVAQLARAGVKVTQSPCLPYVYSMEHGDNISVLPGFAEGVFTVQDASSALAVEAAEIRDTDLVMDICAAPGGKSILAAEKAYKVLARDVSIEKTDVIEENIRRMGAENIEVQVFDATEFDSRYEEKADVVLMDVPCSGLGVMGRKRDIKYRVTPEGLKDLAQLQRRIVDSSWRYVKPGGTLIYSTCTIHSEENEAMVRYISENLPFEPVSLENVLPSMLWERKREMGAGKGQALLTEKQQAACIQLLPGYMECDGFFFARFRRKKCEKNF